MSSIRSNGNWWALSSGSCTVRRVSAVGFCVLSRLHSPRIPRKKHSQSVVWWPILSSGRRPFWSLEYTAEPGWKVFTTGFSFCSIAFNFDGTMALWIFRGFRDIRNSAGATSLGVDGFDVGRYASKSCCWSFPHGTSEMLSWSCQQIFLPVLSVSGDIGTGAYGWFVAIHGRHQKRKRQIEPLSVTMDSTLCKHSGRSNGTEEL